MESKVALITGGGTGIGKAIALALAEKGISVCVNYSKSDQEAKKTVQGIKTKGARAISVQTDISNDKEARRLVEDTIRHFGRLDYLVNNAGITEHLDRYDLEAVTEEHWDRLFDVNVKGTFFVTRAAIPYLKANKGSIVNISSASGITGIASSIAYGASKAAVNNMTKSLARILAPQVRVNAVAPCNVYTRWHKGREAVLAQDNTLLGRICYPEDIADVVVPLLTAENMVTGQVIMIDGGKYL